MGSLLGEGRLLRSGHICVSTHPPKCKRRKVSREVPRDCDPNTTLEFDGGATAEKIIVENMSEQSSELGGPPKNIQDENEIRRLSGTLKSSIFVKDEDEKLKSKLDGAFKNNIERQEISSDLTEVKKAVIVQDLVCASSNPQSQVKTPVKLTPSHIIAELSKARMRYLTRSKSKSEKCGVKSMLIAPCPVDMETCKLSQPSALNDDEDYSKYEEHCGVTIPPLVACSSEVKGQKRIFENESESRSFPDVPKNHITDFMKGKDENIISKIDGFSSSSIELQEKVGDIAEVDESVNVDDLTCTSPTNLSPSRLCTKSSKRMKRGYHDHAQYNQKRYLTRSRGKVEKQEACPKEMRTDKLSRSLALKDDKDYSENEKRDFEFLPGPNHCDVSTPPFVACSPEVKELDKKFEDEMETRSFPSSLINPVMDFVKDVNEKLKSKSDGASSNNIELQRKNNDITEFEKEVIEQDLVCASSYPSRQVEGPAKLSESLDSTKVSKGKKHGYDPQYNPKRYLTRSKGNIEKLEEKSMLIAPCPQDKLSPALALKDDEENSDDEEHDFEVLPGPNHCDVSTPSFAACSPEAKEREKNFEDESEIRSFPSSLINSVTNFEKDEDAKIKSKSDCASNNIDLQEKSSDFTEVEKEVMEHGVFSASSFPCTQAERPGNLSTSHGTTEVSKGKKCGSDAQDSQKRYLTRSKGNAEKLAENSMLIEPCTTEMETAKHFQSLTVKDDKDYSKDEEHDFEFVPGPNHCEVSTPPFVPWSPDTMELEKKFEDGRENRSFPSRLNNSIVDLTKDEDEKIKSKSDGASINFVDLQEKSSGITEVEKGVIEQDLQCTTSYPCRQVETPAKLSPSSVSGKLSKGKKHGCDAEGSQMRYLTRSRGNAEKPAAQSMLITPCPKEREISKLSRPSALRKDKDYTENEKYDFEFPRGPRHCDVSIAPFVTCSSSGRGARTKVRATLRLFQALVRKILQGEETNSEVKGTTNKTAHVHAANVLKEKGKYINTEQVIGAVPGVEIGDIFSHRLELAIVGLHTSPQSDIDTVKQGNTCFATSILSSEGYDTGADDSVVLIYTGQGGSPLGVDKKSGDQKLERGNLALKNCIDERSPVRVIRGPNEAKPSDNGDGRANMIATYTYDGLYTVEKYWYDLGPRGKLVYKFELIRIPGQRQLAWKEVKHSNKSKVRKGCCVDDISKGKEKPPIRAVNTINDEKPPPFTYIISTMYPDWCQPLPRKGCNCKGRCSNRCACAVKNGGEIPYNLSGAIVEAKPLVYECGPSCNCPPSCPNRVSQHGIKFPLEIFKTKSMGWGVRCLSPIPSGSFICEYIGELLDDREAEQRIGSDEYLFDIGQNYNDTTLSDGLSDLMPHIPSTECNDVEGVGFTIDAARYGNIGRFVNHSCSPNLYAQNVLYDHEDERIPHVMLFAAENIPPLQELTYHYNYAIDQVFDSKGNIKKKNCYCGSAECTGRLY